MVDWYILYQVLGDFLTGLLPVLGKIIVAIIVFIVGWYVSVGVGKLIAEILKRVKFNRLFEDGGWKKALDKADVKVDPSEFIGSIFKWSLVLVFLLAVVEIIGLTQFGEFLKGQVLPFVPDVITAVLIFVAAIIIADILEKVIKAAVEGMGAGYAKMAGLIVKWAIWIFAIFAILIQLRVASALIQTLFTGLVAVIVISAGLAFGLGGKDAAREVMEDLRDKFRR